MRTIELKEKDKTIPHHTQAGTTLMGIGMGSDKSRAVDATTAIISSLLIDSHI